MEPYKGASTRYLCPKCSVIQRTFTRYIDTETNCYISETVGKCNREDNCGYHYKPKEYFADMGITREKSVFVIPKSIIPPKPISFIETEFVSRSLSHYETNNFVKFLITKFGQELTEQKCKEYLIGTSKHWNGATIFWQRDVELNYRTGKIMLYNEHTGKRIAGKYGAMINWVHKAIKQPDFNLKQCLFGEHLINNTEKPIAIVESEKNAIIASIYYPELCWLATGSKSNLSIDRCQCLKGKKAFLFPDYGAFADWSAKASQLGFEIDNFIEEYAISSG